jgi:hypothetical protein
MCVNSCVNTMRSQSSVSPMKSTPSGQAAEITTVSRGNGVA